MSSNDSFHPTGPSKKPLQEDVIDLKKIYYLIITNWYFFIITLILALVCAFLYNAFTLPTYRVASSLLIDEEKKGSLMEDFQYPGGIGTAGQMKNLDNQIMVLSSKTLIEKTLDELPFDVEYYSRGLFNQIPLYPDHPIKIESETTDSLPRDIEFTFKHIDKNKFRLKAKSKDSFKLQALSSFGETIKCPWGSIRITSENDIWPEIFNNRKIYFIYHSREALVEIYRKRLKVLPASRKGTIVNITLEGTNKKKDMDFLNKLTEIFLNNSLDKKNEEAIKTIQFIDDQLIGISDSLVITENKLQQFRSTHRVMDLSAQGQVIIDQAMNLENEKARTEIEANYYAYLADYLAKDNIGEVPIAPATMGITDPGLTKLVADLADLQGQLYSKSLGEKNPLQSQLAQRVRNTKEALKETLNGVIRANNLARTENLAQIRTVNAQATALPVTERQLLGIERKFKLNDELYTFLLEKRAVAQIQKASNTTDNEIVDPPKPSFLPVKPKTKIIYFFALIAGIGIPFLWIYIVDALNNKIKNEEDIKEITDIPVVGHLPHSQLKKNTAMLEEPHKNFAEAFRLLRSRIQFFTREAKTPVVLITSSMPEEGKTFTAINLAAAYSLMGKKTVLVGFDLRKPKIYTDFGLSNEKGVSTWLIGKDELQDVIKETSYNNLFIIPAGPVPPNPSELTSLDKTAELLKLLKEIFEYIIIDSSPIGMVSDTFHLASLADTCILIIRQNLTSKDLLESTLKEVKISEIKSICLVVNDMVPGYSYGRSYGYNLKREEGLN